jgi:hypothetical protein
MGFAAKRLREAEDSAMFKELRRKNRSGKRRLVGNGTGRKGGDAGPLLFAEALRAPPSKEKNG